MARKIIYNNILYGILVGKDEDTEKTKFFSPPNCSLQFGIVANTKDYIEPPHTHKKISRTITNLEQMIYVIKGKVAVDFFNDKKEIVETVILEKGDSILLLDGGHSIRVLEDLKCISIKQGPFLGAENDKIAL